MGASLAFAYGWGTPLPFIAPLFALYLTAGPAPPMGAKSLLGLLVVIALTLGLGLVLAPILRLYPVSGVMLIAAGLFASTYLGVGKGKGAVSTLLTMGLTMIPAAGLMGHVLARSVVEALLIGITSGTYSSIFNASLLLYSWNVGELQALFGGRRRAVATAST